MRVRRSLSTLTLVSAVLVGGVLVGGPAAVAAGQVSFTSLVAELTVFSEDPDGEFGPIQPVTDGDGRSDDLRVTFAAEGTGTSKPGIEVKVTRTVNVTCISALSEFSVSHSEPVSSFEGEDPTYPTTLKVTHKPGKWVLTGEVTFPTKFDEVCPRSELSTYPGEVYLVKDYFVTYTDVTVKDSKNGAEASDPGPYSYQDGLEGGFTVDGGVAGLSCTVEDFEQGHCETT